MSRDTVNVRVSPELKLELKDLAYEYKMDHSDFVREILEQGVKNRRRSLEDRKFRDDTE